MRLQQASRTAMKDKFMTTAATIRFAEARPAAPVMRREVLLALQGVAGHESITMSTEAILGMPELRKSLEIN
jgi:hypothetical protein